MPLSKIEQAVLEAWVVPENKGIHDGYEFVARQFNVSLKQARRMVHRALVADGGQPHSPNGVVRAWMHHRRLRRDMEELT